MSIDTITQNSAPSWVLEVAKYRWWILLALIVLLLLLVVIAGSGWRGNWSRGGRGWNSAGRLVTLANHLATGRCRDRSESRELDAADRRGSAAESRFRRHAAGVAPAAGPTTGGDSAQAAAFRGATSDLFTGLLDVPADPAPAPALEFATLRQR